MYYFLLLQNMTTMAEIEEIPDTKQMECYRCDKLYDTNEFRKEINMCPHCYHLTEIDYLDDDEDEYSNLTIYI